jgi:hypothetical protein
MKQTSVGFNYLIPTRGKPLYLTVVIFLIDVSKLQSKSANMVGELRMDECESTLSAIYVCLGPGHTRAVSCFSFVIYLKLYHG